MYMYFYMYIYVFVYIPLSILLYIHIHIYTYILTCDNEEQKYLYDFLIVISRFTLNYFQIPKSFNLVAKLGYIKPKGVIIAALLYEPGHAAVTTQAS